MTVLLDPQSVSNRSLLDGIQGNILKSHGRHHTANIFIHCLDKQQTSAKAWLENLVKGEDAIIQSGYAQLRSNALWKEEKVDTGLFACIHISAAGYDYLFGTDARSSFDDTAFQNGMKQASLGDPDPTNWDSGLARDNHFMLLLAHSSPEALMKSVDEAVHAIESFAEITTIEKGDAQFNEEGAGIEHFGYVDGISQPLFFTDEWEIYKKKNNIIDEADIKKNDSVNCTENDENKIKFDPRAAKELVLVKDPFAPQGTNAWGSYFVFRKLEQDVKGFKLAEAKLAIDLELVGEDKERAGAMLVGRFEDGTPIELNGNPELINSALLNNFTYKSGDNTKCPFHGHIRKTNPRVEPQGKKTQVESNKVMARRGITYGERTDDLNDGHIYNKPTGKVGLLFMSYQASIKDYFEFIQKGANSSTDGKDPIIGQGPGDSEGHFAKTWDEQNTLKTASFGKFVHMKGGEYFFAPSMSFLKNIHNR
ncbi:Dyp-type peroxidase [Spirosoma pulveris]